MFFHLKSFSRCCHSVKFLNVKIQIVLLFLGLLNVPDFYTILIYSLVFP